jgi:hypothetical protein
MWRPTRSEVFGRFRIATATAALAMAVTWASTAMLAAQAPAPAAAAVSVRPDLAAPERLDAWTLDGSGAWTIRDDLLLAAGWQSPTRHYYVHLSGVRDDVHNGIFIVHDADRRRIDDRSDRPALTDRTWHTARLVRTASTGRLEVFVDGETAPIMTATDRTISSGRLGVGSFDDAGAFRGIHVQGVPAAR